MNKTSLPVEFDEFVPARFAGRSGEEVSQFSIRVGNRATDLGNLFSVVPETGRLADVLTLEGDLGNVHGIGKGMCSGDLIVKGVVGPHLGASMQGGTIEVFGDAGDWAGAEMRGGLLRIHGSAGRYLGASLPGSRLGMREGVILVDGSVGEQAGRRMRRGLIAVAGGVAEGVGKNMIAGSIFLFGPVGRYAGLGMKRGTIASFGRDRLDLSPGFAPTGSFEFPFLSIYLKRLKSWGFPVPDEVFSCKVDRYNGDLGGEGKGEILVRSGIVER